MDKPNIFEVMLAEVMLDQARRDISQDAELQALLLQHPPERAAEPSRREQLAQTEHIAAFIHSLQTPTKN
jgi:hypothetical protein